MNLKNFAIGILVVLLLTSNVYWAANWVGRSLDVEGYDLTIWTLEAETIQSLKLISELASMLDKSEIHGLLNKSYAEELWIEGDNLNTMNFEFIYDRETFDEVKRQSKINPGNKG